MKRFALGFVLAGMLLAANSASAIEILTGKEYFLRTPLYALKDKDNQLDWINYSDVSEKLRPGEKVTIIEIKGNVIKFLLNSKVFSFTFTREGLAGTPGIYDKYFTAVDVGEEIGKFGDRIRNNITVGRIEPGMTKEQVLLAAGCPAIAGGKKTYNLAMQDVMQADSWIYYRSRLNKTFVKFADGKVSSFEQ